MSHNEADKRYPKWVCYPRCIEHPAWMDDINAIFRHHRFSICSLTKNHKSDEVLAIIRSDLEAMGFLVEGGDGSATIKRPVFFGEYGEPELQYQIDSYNPEKKIALEVEAGRSKLGNAIYRDIIQTSLLVGVDFFIVAVPQKYRYKSGKKNIEEPTYEICRSILDSIYGTVRFSLPFKNAILIGY